jgi:hypothetical protein
LKLFVDDLSEHRGIKEFVLDLSRFDVDQLLELVELVRPGQHSAHDFTGGLLQSQL